MVGILDWPDQSSCGLRLVPIEAQDPCGLSWLGDLEVAKWRPRIDAVQLKCPYFLAAAYPFLSGKIACYQCPCSCLGVVCCLFDSHASLGPEGAKFLSVYFFLEGLA